MKQLVATIVAFLSLVVLSDLVGFAVAPVSPRERTLFGAEAEAHMRALWAKYPGLEAEHQKTVEQLEARGLTPSDRFMVSIKDHEEPRPLRRLTALLLPTLSAQSYGNGDGEVDVNPWDTPTGSAADVTIVHYASGAYTNGYVEFDVSSGSPVVTNATPTPIARWGHCVLVGCSAAAASCTIAFFLGAGGWAGCTLAWCGGAEVGCGVEELVQWWCRSRYSLC